MQHFRQFCNTLNERGVDTRKVKYGKAEAALWAIEHLNKAKKKEAAVIQSGKDLVKETYEKTASIIVPDEDDSVCRWKREVIYGRGNGARC